MTRVKWAIEDSFPIVEINRLAVPERNSFKPIYQMHKWFARRASCVFRAILLGALKPLPLDEDGNPTQSGAQVIMEEFYKNHTHDSDTNGKLILDPFMGGGTTVVEALRLGCKVIGIDLNPVAWFIVKTEVEPVDVDQLKQSFDELANRIVPWSGKPLKQTLLDLYRTTCPCCGSPDADIIYTFWVKSAICTNPTCHKPVPLFTDFIVGAKQPSIRYHQDVVCSKCSKTFDWEIEPASLIAESSLTVVNNLDGAGVGRGNKRWAFSPREPVDCPWCNQPTKPMLGRGRARPLRKKVSLTVLLCPHCQSIWQYRGGLADQVNCPSCQYQYSPSNGNVDRGKFVCPACGTKGGVIESARSQEPGCPLPMNMYAIRGYCAACDKAAASALQQDNQLVLPEMGDTQGARAQHVAPARHRCLLEVASGVFFKRIHPDDLERVRAASDIWSKHQDILPHPKGPIPRGEKTKTHLLGHNYLRWSQLFNDRQLVCLSTILASIRDFPDHPARYFMLSNFQMLLERNSLFCRYYNDRAIVRGMFARHDFHPLNSPAETNVMGSAEWGGTWDNLKERLLEGKRFNHAPFDWRPNLGAGRIEVASGEKIDGRMCELRCEDSRNIGSLTTDRVDAVITDPPYADNVNYSELSDFFYVWLRLGLEHENACFAPELTPKSAEIVENKTRGISRSEYKDGLTQVFRESIALVSSDAVIVFTFHHREGTAWEALLESLMEAGLSLSAVYPIHGESESSMHLMDKEGGISYDLIHVCRKRTASVTPRSWAGIRQEIRRRSRAEIEVVELGRYGNEPLGAADVNIILIGKCLELYSQHYGQVLDHVGRNVPLHEALESIKMEVDQLVSHDQPLPSELADIDPVSYIYLLCLADRTSEIKSDELHKYTRGVLEPDELIKAGLIIKGRAGRGRHFDIKSPNERFTDLQEKFRLDGGVTQAALPGMEEVVNVEGSRQHGIYFIDYVHYLMGLVEGGENLRQWLERFRRVTPQIRSACEYLRQCQPRFASACDKILKFLDVSPLFKGGSGS